jgi:hypothetical protein
MFVLGMAAAGSVSAASYGFGTYGSGAWSDVSKWRDNSSGSWANSTGLPGASDNVSVNNNATLALDMNAEISYMALVTTAAGATLNINQADRTLTLGSTLAVGHASQTGVGVVNQSAGTLSAGGVITINDKGTYNLTSGTLQAGNTINVVGNGLLDIKGGTVTSAVSSVRGFGGTGTVKLQSGSVIMAGTSAVRLDSDLFEISGGSLTLDANVVLGYAKAAEMKIIGDEATLNFKTFSQAANNGASGTIRFVLDETGVSTINVAEWINLEASTLVVDGSAYTGGAGTFDLITSGSFMPANIADTNKFSITGFANGAFITQDTDANKVTLTVIPEPATLGMFITVGAGLLIGRRWFCK